VTVTHPEMRRYFMTIPEAVSLVVQAGGIGGYGQVFVLDMGEPVRIVDLAQNMIRLSGKEPRMPDDPTTSPRDVRIAFVGSRPGEKIHEELWSEDDSVAATTHPKILRLSRPPVDPDWLEEQLAELERLADEGDTLEVVGKLRNVVSAPRRLTAPVPPPLAADSAPSGLLGTREPLEADAPD
jgi:FlaA1/EpsC-like NDP-sugar epimerase